MKLFGDSGKHQHQAHRSDRSDGKVSQETVAFTPVSTAAAVEKRPRKSETKKANKTAHARLSRGTRTAFTVLGCIIVLILAVIIGYSIWEKPPVLDDSGLRVPDPTPDLNRPVITSPEPTKEPVNTDEPVDETPVPTEDPSPKHYENCYTFLILAYDQVGASTDTILVGRMDTEAGTLSVVNIPRDTLVDVSWGIKKVNTILAGVRNDMDSFKDELSEILGFKVDCYAVVNINAVEKLIDCIGGVYYDVPRNMDYDDPTQNLSIHIAKGYQLLNGEDAVKVLRFREGNNGTGYATGDMGRIATQQDFLKSIASQMLSLGNIPNLSEAIDIFVENVKTDMTANNIAFFAREFLMMNKDNVTFQTVPGEAVSIRLGSYYQINVDEWVAMLNEHVNPYNRPITAENLNILNKNGSQGAISSNGDLIPITSFEDYGKYIQKSEGE